MTKAAEGVADAGNDGGFSEFAAAGEVEVGQPAIESNLPEEPEEKPAKKPKAAAVAKTPADPDDADPDDKAADDDETGEDEEAEEKAKKSHKPSDRIRELNKRLRQEERLRLASDARLDALEKSLLPKGSGDANSSAIGLPSPDPTDSAKYPLGHLDDRYIEDKLDWLATQKAAERADAVLQRQQEGEQNQMLERQQEALLEKVDDLSTRGSELFDDFQESVVESGMRGDWRLDQPTFEAAHEAENGAQILYELSQNKAEAKRVAGLTPYQQMKFVMDRDAEISIKGKPRTRPGAGAPPTQTTRGANSSTRINPATDNLDDFEKAWAADVKATR